MEVCGLIFHQLQELHDPGGIFKETCRKFIEQVMEIPIKVVHYC